MFDPALIERIRTIFLHDEPRVTIETATDMLGWSGTGSSCSFQQPPIWPVVNGNISVHDA